jgi:lipid-A-disaccharide synthase-like uncharacterized protein
MKDCARSYCFAQMNNWNIYWIYAIGFLSQGLFAARLVIQWYLSEKEGKIVSPIIYWQISLVATYLFIFYGILQNDFVIILGMALSYIISLRNLQLDGSWNSMPSPIRLTAIALPLATVAWIFVPGSGLKTDFYVNDFFNIIVLSGAVGQLLLNFRFIYQWYYAEKLKISVLPLGFWVMTAVGSVLVVIYAISRFDPVLIFAQGLGLFASLRNIQLHFRAKEAN